LPRGFGFGGSAFFGLSGPSGFGAGGSLPPLLFGDDLGVVGNLRVIGIRV
jgi:hypothetical protein